jgi:hypothetical protein
MLFGSMIFTRRDPLVRHECCLSWRVCSRGDVLQCRSERISVLNCAALSANAAVLQKTGIRVRSTSFWRPAQSCPRIAVSEIMRMHYWIPLSLLDGVAEGVDAEMDDLATRDLNGPVGFVVHAPLARRLLPHLRSAAGDVVAGAAAPCPHSRGRFYGKRSTGLIAC